MVKEEYPLKQGLKNSGNISLWNFNNVVKEEYPLKQGLKLFLNFLLNLLPFLLKKSIH